MCNHTSPECLIGSNWGIGGDLYTCILTRKTGNSWKKSYYGSPEQQLKSPYRVIMRTEPASPSLTEQTKAVAKPYRQHTSMADIKQAPNDFWLKREKLHTAEMRGES